MANKACTGWCMKHSLPRGNVDFQDPGLKVLIQHNIKPKQLMAAIRTPHIHLHKVDYVGL